MPAGGPQTLTTRAQAFTHVLAASVRGAHILHRHSPCQPAPLADTSPSAPRGAVKETQPRRRGQEQQTKAGQSEPGRALAVYSACQPWRPSWARATLWGASWALAGLSGFFGVWVGVRVIKMKKKKKLDPQVIHMPVQV